MKKISLIIPAIFVSAVVSSCGLNRSYTVKFDTDGGTEIADVKVDGGKTVARPEQDPTKENYYFTDWVTTKGGDDKFDFDNTKITADTTIYADWAAEKTNLKFDLNTEKEEYKEYIADKPDSQLIPFNKCANKPSDPYTTAGSWQFAGWYENADCTGKSFDFKTALKTKTGEKTLYANWVQNKVVAIFVYSDDYYDYVLSEPGQPIAKPEDPTYHGFTFEGWYADEARTEKFNFDTPIPSGQVSVKIYAKWERADFTVHFDLNGGAGTIADQSVKYEGKAKRPTVTPTKEGYHFNNWFKDKELTTLFDFDNEIITDNTTIYAGYSANEYTITFDSQGGSFVEPIHITSEQVLEKPTDPTFTGHVFGGWFENSECTGDAFSGWGQKVNKSFTLYAKWTDAEYTITFNVGGTTTTQKVKHGGLVVKPDDPTPTGAGIFVAWYNESTFDTAFDFATPITANKTLYAGFGHTVTFDTTDVSEETFKSQVIVSGKTAVYPGVPTKLKTPGLNCYGWKDENSDTEYFDFENTLINQDITLVPATVSNVITIQGAKNLELGQTYELKALIGSYQLNPSDVTWTLDSESAKIISVDESGKITTKSNTNGGTAYINASYNYESQDYKGTIRVEVGSYTYLNKDLLKTGVVSAKTNAIKGHVVIPAYYCYENEWIELKTIKNHGFCDCDQITSVVIPETITEIGESAFSCFTRQQSQYGGFDPTGNIKSITFTGTSRLEKIGVEAFDGQKELTSLVIPASVKEIGAAAFLDNKKLTSVYFEDAKGPWDIIASSVSEGESVTGADLSKYAQEDLCYGLTKYSWDDTKYGKADFTWKKTTK